MTGRQLTVITMPQPTANGPLHVGHLSGPYIAADIAARAVRDLAPGQQAAQDKRRWQRKRSVTNSP